MLALVVLPACYAVTGVDAGTDGGTVADVLVRPDVRSDAGRPPEAGLDAGLDAGAGMRCGTGGLRCLSVGDDERPASMGCIDVATAPAGVEREIDLNLVSRATAREDISGDIELWRANVIGSDCGASVPDCELVSETVDGNVSVTLSGGWYAYRVLANPEENTFLTLGSHRLPGASGAIDTITSINRGVWRTAATTIRPGLSLDIEDGLLMGEALDCDGVTLEGATARLFGEDGVELVVGTEAMDLGLAYQVGGALPNPRLQTTDVSGAFMVANIPVPPDGLVNVVTYGGLAEGEERRVIGCERVSVAADAVSIVRVGPLRADYPDGSFCVGVTAE